MSELRDLTMVFREIQKSLRDIGNHVAAQDAHSEQLRLSLHNLRNDLASREIFSETQERELKQIHVWMGSFSNKQVELSDSIKALGEALSDHRREINGRISSLEPQDEVTK